MTRQRAGAPRCCSKLALVDFGQAKELNAEQRLKLARLLCGLARCDKGPSGPTPQQKASLARMLREMGMSTKRDNADVAYALGQIYFDRDDELVGVKGLLSPGGCLIKCPLPIVFIRSREAGTFKTTSKAYLHKTQSPQSETTMFLR